MSAFQEDNPDFESFIQEFQNDPASDEDITLIKSLAVDAVQDTPVVSYASYGMRLNAGTVYIESSQTNNKDTTQTSATVELFAALKDETDEEGTEPFVRIIFDSSKEHPVSLDRDSSHVSRENATAIVSIAQQAIEHANGELEAALFKHVAAIGMHLHNRVGELVIGDITYNNQAMQFEDIARAVALRYYPELREERTTTLVSDGNSRLRITTHDYTNIRDEFEYYTEMPHVEIDILNKNRQGDFARTLGVCISHSGEAIVTYLTDEEERSSMATLNPSAIENAHQELGTDQLRTDDARLVIDGLIAALAQHLHPEN